MAKQRLFFPGLGPVSRIERDVPAPGSRLLPESCLACCARWAIAIRTDAAPGANEECGGGFAQVESPLTNYGGRRGRESGRKPFDFGGVRANVKWRSARPIQIVVPRPAGGLPFSGLACFLANLPATHVSSEPIARPMRCCPPAGPTLPDAGNHHRGNLGRRLVAPRR